MVRHFGKPSPRAMAMHKAQGKSMRDDAIVPRNALPFKKETFGKEGPLVNIKISPWSFVL